MKPRAHPLARFAAALVLVAVLLGVGLSLLFGGLYGRRRRGGRG